MKNIKILSVFLMLVIFFASCEKDDYTGYSTETPTNPTITVEFGTIPATISDGVNSSIKVTLTMSEPQIVDVAVHVLTTGGTATEGEDFSIPERVIIPAGRTTKTFEVKFLGDELPEDTETFTIQVGDERTANATITPVTQEFTIENATKDDLNLELSWGGDIWDANTGEYLNPTDAADMMLLVMDDALNVLDGADGASFEAYTMLASNYPDGTYYIATAFYDAFDFGDFGGQDLNFNLDYGQFGVQFGGLEFPGILNTVTNFNNTYILAKIVKSGANWTVNKFNGFNAADVNFASSNWGGTDGSLSSSYDWRFPSLIVTAGTTGNYTIDGLNMYWMEWVWGETVLSTTPVAITFNDDGTLEIADQYYMTTDWGDYNVSGTGTWNRYMLPAAMVIHYEMYNTTDGYGVADWLINNGYSDYPYFIADVVNNAKNPEYMPVGHVDNKPSK